MTLTMLSSSPAPDEILRVTSRCQRITDEGFGSDLSHVIAESKFMRCLTVPLVLFLFAQAAMADEAKVTPLMAKGIVGLPGKEAVMISVEYAPGQKDPIHRHNAQAFVYVTQGAVTMQLRGGKRVTLGVGQTFYEGPEDVHVLGMNASKTRAARFVVFLIKNKDAPVLVPTE